MIDDIPNRPLYVYQKDIIDQSIVIFCSITGRQGALECFFC